MVLMKLDIITSLAQPTAAFVGITPQLTLPAMPLLAELPILIPSPPVIDSVTITPLRQAFFTTPVASDFETEIRPVSLVQQFDLARTHPLLASAATELARLSESASTVSSLVFAKPAVVNAAESPLPVITPLEVDTIVERILQMPSLDHTKTFRKDVAPTDIVVAKTDGGSFIQDSAVKDSVRYITLISSLRTLHQQDEAISRVNLGDRHALRARDDGVVKITDRSLIQSAAHVDSAIEKTDGGSLIENTTNTKSISIADKTNGGSLVPKTEVHLSLSVESSDIASATQLRPVLQQGKVASPGLRSDNKQTSLAAKPSKIDTTESGKIKDEPLLAKFGPLGPVLPGGPIRPRVSSPLDLRALFVPLEDRKVAIARNKSRDRVAKIDQMSADADSEGGQSQNGEPQQ